MKLATSGLIVVINHEEMSDQVSDLSNLVAWQDDCLQVEQSNQCGSLTYAIASVDCLASRFS